MLNNRYKFDPEPLLFLNNIQKDNKKAVESKIASKKYLFENTDCVICYSSDFELLSAKDRYGLEVNTVICKKCGLIQTNPRMNQAAFNEFYDNEYRKLYVGEDKPTEQFFLNQLEHGNEILKFVESKEKIKFENKFVVEIGTGAGGILQAFKNKKNKVFGLDLGTAYINFGISKGLNLKVGTLKELENLDEKPDLIIYSHVLEHLLEPLEELKELKKYFKDKTILYIEVPGVKNLLYSYNQDFLQFLQNAHIYHFTLDSLNNLTSKAGYRLKYGNEKIVSIYEIGEINDNFKSDYLKASEYLKNLEKIKTNPINIFRIKKIALNFRTIFKHIGFNIYIKLTNFFKSSK